MGTVAVNVGHRGEAELVGFFYGLPVSQASVLFVVLAGIERSF